MEHWTTRIAFFMGLMMCASAVFGQRDADSLFTLSLEDLMKVKVTTASNKDEELGKAPATIIVITEEEINERGYFELYDVLNDLPGFDLSRAFGDDNYYAYVRGYRKTTSDQMLLMIDGIIMNHLFNNNMNAYAQYPLQNIKQIEIVYGPASAIYGPNAFTGVINLITKKEGISSVQTTFGQNNTSNIDIHLSQKIDDFTLNFSGRLYESDGPDLEGRTPMLRNELFTNPLYWGDFANTDFTGYKSPIRSNFINTSVGYKGFSVGLINYFYESGLGTEFAGGTTLNAGTWQFKENTIYAKYEGTFDKITTKTLLKYRRSDIPGSSTFLWRWFYPDDETFSLDPEESRPVAGTTDVITNNTGGTLGYVIDRNEQYAEYWQATNASYSLFQDFTYNPNEQLVVNFGIKYDRRTLNRNYKINTNTVLREFIYLDTDVNRQNLLNPVPLKSFPFPDRPDDATIDQENHNTINDKGVYVQTQYSPSEIWTITGGLRYDYNSVWKGVFSPRIGAVIEPTSGLILKGFFGTAFLEPSARILYGGWAGSISNDKLEPEKMRTFEFSGAYTKNIFSVGLNWFYNVAPDAIGVGAGKVPINLGKRRMIGTEFYGKILLRNLGPAITKLRGDLYISQIKSEEDLGDTGDYTETGNMAPIKVKLIGTILLWNKWSLSLQNRYISEIETVSSNPIKKIDAWFVSDFFTQVNDFPIKGLSVGIKVYNIFNKDYFHPGYRAADAGEESVDNALFNTSWYNSRLPQPERTFLFNMRYKF
jgi:outer membrane receptor for ferrienterochelin and colicins